TGGEPACAVGVWRSWLRLYRKPQSHLQNKSRRLLRLERAYQLWVFFIQPFLIPGKQIHGATMPEGKATLAVELGLKQPSFAGEALLVKVASIGGTHVGFGHLRSRARAIRLIEWVPAFDLYPWNRWLDAAKDCSVTR